MSTGTHVQKHTISVLQWWQDRINFKTPASPRSMSSFLHTLQELLDVVSMIFVAHTASAKNIPMHTYKNTWCVLNVVCSSHKSCMQIFLLLYRVSQTRLMWSQKKRKELNPAIGGQAIGSLRPIHLSPNILSRCCQTASEKCAIAHEC